MLQLRAALVYLVARLPGSTASKLFRWFFGWDVHPTARIGHSYISCVQLRLGAGSRIGSGTLIKGLGSLCLEQEAVIGNLNWISAYPESNSIFFAGQQRSASLLLGVGAAITSRHIIDCTTTVELGRFSIIAGFRSQVLTHSVNIDEGRQVAATVVIGDYCFVGTGVILLPGSSIPTRCVVGAGSVVKGKLERQSSLYGGVPAKYIQPVDSDAGFFTRVDAVVW